MTKQIVIWGASGHALVVADIVRLRGEYEIIGFIDDVNSNRHGTSFYGMPILGGREQLEILKELGVKNLIFGFGDCEARLKLSELALAKGFELVTMIHPSAIIAKNVEIGPGTVAAAGAVVNPGSKIGNNVIINTSASVDHECIIEEGVHICPGVHLAGRVYVKRATWVGIGSTVIENIRIGSGCLVGAGAVVIHDIPDNSVVYGVPAKPIRKKI